MGAAVAGCLVLARSRRAQLGQEAPLRGARGAARPLRPPAAGGQGSTRRVGRGILGEQVAHLLLDWLLHAAALCAARERSSRKAGRAPRAPLPFSPSPPLQARD
jgi:hypothetical protein